MYTVGVRFRTRAESEGPHSSVSDTGALNGTERHSLFSIRHYVHVAGLRRRTVYEIKYTVHVSKVSDRG